MDSMERFILSLNWTKPEMLSGDELRLARACAELFQPLLCRVAESWRKRKPKP